MRILYLFTICIFLFAVSVTQIKAQPFDHDAHNGYLEEDSTCATCHLPDARAILPDTAVCQQCHEDTDFIDSVTFPSLKTHGTLWGFNHRAAAKSKAIDCSQCHQQSLCLECHKAGFADEQHEFSNNLTNVHRGEFQVSHPIAARTNPQLCASCHENKFCSDCHNTFNRADLAFSSHRRSWSDISISGTAHSNFNDTQCQTCHPDSVLPSHSWSNNHSREARKNLATCQACHPEGDICIKCHSAISGLRVNPHPDNWGSISSRLSRASDRRTCRKCH